MNKIILGAGCFWGAQHYLDQVPGVTKTIVGYSGGHTKNPTYEEVCTGMTGHTEVVLIEYDPQAILLNSHVAGLQDDTDQQAEALRVIMKHFFYIHDPTQVNGQGPDV